VEFCLGKARRNGYRFGSDHSGGISARREHAVGPAKEITRISDVLLCDVRTLKVMPRLRGWQRDPRRAPMFA